MDWIFYISEKLNALSGHYSSAYSSLIAIVFRDTIINNEILGFTRLREQKRSFKITLHSYYTSVKKKKRVMVFALQDFSPSNYCLCFILRPHLTSIQPLELLPRVAFFPRHLLSFLR